MSKRSDITVEALNGGHDERCGDQAKISLIDECEGSDPKV
jgi:hypothetical protein